MPSQECEEQPWRQEPKTHSPVPSQGTSCGPDMESTAEQGRPEPCLHGALGPAGEADHRQTTGSPNRVAVSSPWGDVAGGGPGRCGQPPRREEVIPERALKMLRTGKGIRGRGGPEERRW